MNWLDVELIQTESRTQQGQISERTRPVGDGCMPVPLDVVVVYYNRFLNHSCGVCIKASALFNPSFVVCKISVAGLLALSPDEVAVSHPTR